MKQKHTGRIFIIDSPVGRYVGRTLLPVRQRVQRMIKDANRVTPRRGGLKYSPVEMAIQKYGDTDSMTYRAVWSGKVVGMCDPNFIERFLHYVRKFNSSRPRGLNARVPLDDVTQNPTKDTPLYEKGTE